MSTDTLPVIAFSPEASDSWLTVVDRFSGYGVTLTLADGEEVDAVYLTQTWDEVAGDYRVTFYRAIDDDYPSVEEIREQSLAVETAVGVRQILVF